LNDIRLPADNPSIAHEFNRAGYHSAYIGKWHLEGISRHMFTPPERRHGFDHYWAAYNCHHNYLSPKYYLNDDPNLVREAGYEPEIQTNLAIKYLHEHGVQPFNLWLSFGTPHDPYDQVPQEYLDLYPPEKLSLRPNALSPDRQAIAGYYAHISAIDVCVVRLLESLEQLGLSDNTLVVFTSDHGDMLWSHMLRNKRLPYEKSIHIPLIMRIPWLPNATGTNESLISVVDLYPTLLGLCGLTVPTEMQGCDLSGCLQGMNHFEQPSVFINNYGAFDLARGMQPWRGIRTRQYTYARWLQGSCVLFDNLNDPFQQRNLALEPDQNDLLLEMEQELKAWLLKNR